MRHQQDSRKKEVYRLVAQIRTPEEAEFLLEDLLSPSELEAIAGRWQIVKKLMDGRTQRSVREEVGVSIATVTRGAHVLKYGTGSFQKFKERLK